MTNALMSIQIIPSVPKGENVYDYVDEAIAVIEEANVTYEVSPLATTMEGDIGELLAVVQNVNERMKALRASNVISQIKILYQPAGVAMDTLTEKYK
ncbi:MAG TPA: thiamine-binding protein [Pseudogracilibacillus sp.]|nr:thiamine-binding protein [Pseudogracilibacillus sp.]